MGIQNLGILSGATVSASGGSAKTYTPNGQTIPNGVQTIDASVVDFRVRPTLTWKVRQPTLKNGVYTKDKKVATLSVPRILDSGQVVFDVIRLEREVHPETSAANALDMNVQAAQLLIDSDAASFWATGSTA